MLLMLLSIDKCVNLTNEEQQQQQQRQHQQRNHIKINTIWCKTKATAPLSTPTVLRTRFYSSLLLFLEFDVCCDWFNFIGFDSKICASYQFHFEVKLMSFCAAYQSHLKCSEKEMENMELIECDRLKWRGGSKRESVTFPSVCIAQTHTKRRFIWPHMYIKNMLHTPFDQDTIYTTTFFSLHEMLVSYLK